MEKMHLIKWQGNTGFTLKIGEESVAEVQEHRFVDKGDRPFYCVFELMGSCTHDDFLYYTGMVAAIDSVAEHLKANGRPISTTVFPDSSAYTIKSN